MGLSWVDYWNGDSPVYVNDRHKALHAKAVAGDIITLIETPDAKVLDYGCGEALEASRVASRCGTLYLHDAAPAVLAKLMARVADQANIRPVDAEAVWQIEDNSLDLIVINSVAQYIPKDDFAALIARLAGKLKSGGRLVLGDLLPPGLSPVTDAKALLSFGFNGGFLIPAMLGLVRTYFSEYRNIRSALGLMHYAPEEAVGVLEAAGLKGKRLARNFGHNQVRMAFEGRKP
ncbi:MAG: class I SAM-dependent methyltransferase [Proteobacteria bacterium]|nr:class I SAM-dependent methyltransferase [Pseudomonadota bacterium]